MADELDSLGGLIREVLECPTLRARGEPYSWGYDHRRGAGVSPRHSVRSVHSGWSEFKCPQWVVQKHKIIVFSLSLSHSWFYLFFLNCHLQLFKLFMVNTNNDVVWEKVGVEKKDQNHLTRLELATVWKTG